MNCKNFKNWLVDPDAFVESATDSAMAHIKLCSECEKLYHLDGKIEDNIRLSFKKTAPPERFLKQVELNSAALDTGGKSMWLKSFVPFFAAAMIILFIYPSGWEFTSTEQLANLAIADHIGSPAMQFAAGEVNDVPKWFEEKIGKRFIIPVNTDKSMEFEGGLKCHLGKTDVALLCYRKNDKPVSLFIVDQDDIGFDFGNNEKVSMSKNNYSVKIWKETGQIYAMVE